MDKVYRERGAPCSMGLFSPSRLYFCPCPCPCPCCCVLNTPSLAQFHLLFFSELRFSLPTSSAWLRMALSQAMPSPAQVGTMPAGQNKRLKQEPATKRMKSLDSHPQLTTERRVGRRCKAFEAVPGNMIDIWQESLGIEVACPPVAQARLVSAHVSRLTSSFLLPFSCQLCCRNMGGTMLIRVVLLKPSVSA